MNNVNHDYNNNVQDEEAQTLANKIAGSTVAIVGGEYSQLKTLKQIIIESQGNSEIFIITRDKLDEMLLIKRKNRISDCLEVISEDAGKVNYE